MSKERDAIAVTCLNSSEMEMEELVEAYLLHFK